MGQEVKDGRWTRMVRALVIGSTIILTYASSQSRFRIDGVNIDHLQAATGNEGLVSWIVSGKVDAVLDIKFPRDPRAFDIGEIFEGLAAAAAEQIEGARRAGVELGIPLADRIPGQRELAKPALQAPDDEDQVEEEPNKPVVVIDIDLRFRDLKAAMPLFTNELSYVNHALVRPIVSFIKWVFATKVLRLSLTTSLKCQSYVGSYTLSRREGLGGIPWRMDGKLPQTIVYARPNNFRFQMWESMFYFFGRCIPLY